MATALTPQTDVTSRKSHVTDGEPETVVSASLQKIKSINIFFFFFNLIKSETSDSFDNHFDGHFAYLKTLVFYFKVLTEVSLEGAEWVTWSEVHRKTIPKQGTRKAMLVLNKSSFGFGNWKQLFLELEWGTLYKLDMYTGALLVSALYIKTPLL